MGCRNHLHSVCMRVVAMVFGLMLAACAHQSRDLSGEVADVESVSKSDDQLQAMVDSADDETNREPQSEEETSGDLTAELSSKNSETEMVATNEGAATTDDLVAQMKPEPETTAISGRIIQGQSDGFPTFSVVTEKKSKPVLLAKVTKKMDTQVIQAETVPVPAPAEAAFTGPVTYPDKATVVPVERNPAESNSEPPELIEPPEDQFKTEVEKEKTLASAEVGSIFMKPWFPWVAIVAGFTGFLVLGLARYRKRRGESAE